MLQIKIEGEYLTPDELKYCTKMDDLDTYNGDPIHDTGLTSTITPTQVNCRKSSATAN